MHSYVSQQSAITSGVTHLMYNTELFRITNKETDKLQTATPRKVQLEQACFTHPLSLSLSIISWSLGEKDQSNTRLRPEQFGL